jgi:magnesium chelatase family protein
MIQRYLGKISGPLLDRIDIHLEVPAVPYNEMRATDTSESSADIRAVVERTRAIQRTRRFYNAQMPTRHIRKLCNLDDCRRAHPRNGRAPDGTFGPRTRPHFEIGAHHCRCG